MRTALALALLPLPTAADQALLRIGSQPRVMQVDAADIASAEMEPSMSGEAMIWVELVRSRHADWLAFTTDGAGERAFIHLCNELVSDVMIQSPISGGRIGIIGPTEPELTAMVELLAGRRGCGRTS